MEQFETSRVRVVHPDEDHETLRGKVGTVVRKLIRSREAWVRMDEEIGSLAVFPSDDERHNNVCLWPDECEAA